MLHRTRRDQSRLLAYEFDAVSERNSQLKTEVAGLLQAIRDRDETIADLREQRDQLRDENEALAHSNRLLEGEREVIESQMKILLAGEATYLSWIRTQKTLFEAESSRAVQSRRMEDA